MSSFTPVNQGPAAFKPATKVVRRHSGGFDALEAADSHKLKRRKTEDASERDTSQREDILLGPNQIPSSLHLGAPSKPRKRKTAARAKSVPEVFLDAPVTKLRRSKGKKVAEQTISYQGFTTTEDSLQDQTKLAKTTLDKPVSFRYRPESTDKEILPPANLSADHSHSQGQEDWIPSTDSKEDKDFMLLDVAHFEDAYLERATEYTPPSPYHEIQTEDAPVLQSFAVNDDPDSLPKPFIYERSASSCTAVNEASQFQFLADEQSPVPCFRFKTTEDSAMPDVRTVDHSQVVRPELASTSCKSQERDVTRASQNQFSDDIKLAAVAVDLGLRPSMPVGFIATNQSEPAFSTDVRPNFDFQTPANDAAMEFGDDDINDEDLYAMSFNDEVGRERNQSVVRPDYSQTNAVPIANNVDSSKTCTTDYANLTGREDDMRNGFDVTICEQPAPLGSPQANATPDSEDEFTMDEEDEEALMELSGITNARGPSPSALPFPSEGDSREFEVYDRALQYSEPSISALDDQNDARNMSIGTELLKTAPDKVTPEENWSFLDRVLDPQPNAAHSSLVVAEQAHSNCEARHSSATGAVESQECGQPHGDEAEYLPLNAFARPQFPTPMRDRSPVIGFSGSLVLRTCFRIGEAFRAAAESDSATYSIMIELFARVTFSSREQETVKQHFQFADLFHDRPPFLNGLFENYKVSDLANVESRQLLGDSKSGQMVRCLGKIRREYQGKRLLVIDNLRITDWEEIRRTKRIVEDISGKTKHQIVGTRFL